MDPVQPIGFYQQKAEKLRANITLVSAVDLIFNLAREIDYLVAFSNKAPTVIPEVKKKNAKLV